MSKEAMKLALEALEYIEHNYMSLPAPAEKAITALREALAEPQEKYIYGTPLLDAMTGKANEALDRMAENAREVGLDYEPAQQEPVAWKLVPREPTHEMLKAMDECSTEGYDERLYAGHAASVYMAAVDAAPTPPAQRTWVGLTDADKQEAFDETQEASGGFWEFADYLEAKLKEKNT